MNESRTVQLVVLFLGLIALAGIIAVAWLIHSGAEAEAITPLVGLIGPAVGALAALLASTNSINLRGLQELSQSRQASPPSGPPA